MFSNQAEEYSKTSFQNQEKMVLNATIGLGYIELKETINNYSFEPQMKIFYIKKHFFD